MSRCGNVLHTFLSIFEASFPLKYKSIHKNKMTGLHKEKKLVKVKGRNIYIYIYIYTAVPVIRAFYIKYCKFLIKLYSRLKYTIIKLTSKPDNKIETAWNIIKQEIGKIHVTGQMPPLLTNNEK
jgi:hypothetical protein